MIVWITKLKGKQKQKHIAVLRLAVCYKVDKAKLTLYEKTNRRSFSLCPLLHFRLSLRKYTYVLFFKTFHRKQSDSATRPQWGVVRGRVIKWEWEDWKWRGNGKKKKELASRRKKMVIDDAFKYLEIVVIKETKKSEWNSSSGKCQKKRTY